MAQYYAFGLLLLYFIFLVAEFLIPSAGLIGIAAVVTALATILVAFAESMQMGIGFTAAIVATTPVILYYMIRMWPHTPLGRRILNRRPGDRYKESARKMRDGTPLQDLVGRTGIAQTDLLPSGRVLIDDQKLDAVSTGMPIDAGSTVMVLSTVAGKIHVRAVRPDETTTPNETTPETDSQQSAQSLEGSLDSLDLDAFE